MLFLILLEFLISKKFRSMSENNQKNIKINFITSSEQLKSLSEEDSKIVFTSVDNTIFLNY